MVNKWPIERCNIDSEVALKSFGWAQAALFWQYQLQSLEGSLLALSSKISLGSVCLIVSLVVQL